MEEKILRTDPCVFVVGRDYQIIFLTETDGIGWIEIDNERFTDEECGLLKYGQVHKIPVPGETLNRAGRYTVVFVEYREKTPYFPKGVEKLRKEYRFYPACRGEDFRLFQFADTHARVQMPLELYRACGDCDLILLNGDINEWSDKIEHFYTSYELAGAAARGERPVIYSRGNHDTRGHSAERLADYIPTAFRDGRRETFYSFRQGSLWGLVLDCGEDKYDFNEEYGGTIQFDTFRARETRYLKSLIANAEREYAAPGVKNRIAFCHVPFVERFEYPFDVAGDVYDEWTRLLGEMGVELLLCGHMHQAYFIEPRDPSRRDAAFPTAVCSIPAKRDEANGKEYYVGGMITVRNGERYVEIVPEGKKMNF